MNRRYVSLRVLQRESSPNAAASQRAKKLIAEGKDIIDLTIGEPDFETPDYVKIAAAEAMINGETRYPPIMGTRKLRASISGKLKQDNDLNYSVEQIIVSNGAKQVISNALAASIDPGHEIIIPSPYYPSYIEMVCLCGGIPVTIKTRASDGFKLTRELLECAINSRTRWLIINSPCNPSGAVYGEEELKMVAEILRDNPHVMLLLDEVYDQIQFFEAPTHFLKIAPELSDRTLLVNSVSKSYAMTGWRVGYGAGPLPLIDAMGIIQSQTTSGVSSISQAAAIAALNGGKNFIENCLLEYRDRSNILVQGLSGIDGIELMPPAGGLFLFLNCHALFGRKAKNGKMILTETDFVEYMLEVAGVACIPGGVYGVAGYIRLSIAAPVEKIMSASARISAAIGQLTKQ